MPPTFEKKLLSVKAYTWSCKEGLSWGLSDCRPNGRRMAMGLRAVVAGSRPLCSECSCARPRGHFPFWLSNRNSTGDLDWVEPRLRLSSGLPDELWSLLPSLCPGHVLYADIKMENGKSKGCGVVKFESPEVAERACRMMNGMKLSGREIDVRIDRNA